MEIDKYKQIKPVIYRAATRKYDPLTRTYNQVGTDYNEIATPSGAYKEDVWDKLMLEAAAKDGLMDLLNGIKEHVKANCLWLKESEVEHYALSCLSSGAYKAWKNFSYQMSLF